MILVLWLFPPPVEILLAKSLQLCLDSLRPCGLQPTRLLKAPLSMGFSRQEYWSGLPCPLPGDLPSPVIEPPSLRSPALAGGFFTTRATSQLFLLKLEPIIQNEVSQKEKYQYSILTHIYGIQKDGNDNPVYETAKETLMYRTVFWTLWERERVR